MVKKSKATATAAKHSRTAVLVLGMHRSGTSALAGVFGKMGCALPSALMAPSAANAKGFFESTAIRDLNDEILDSAGSSWDDFLALSPNWSRSPVALGFEERARQVLRDDFGTTPLFLLKDPRICRMAAFWIRVLESMDCSVKPVLTVRNPNEVARSLRQKKRMTGPLSQMIWLRHALDAEAATRSMKRYHTSYEMLVRRWPQVVIGAEQALDMNWPRSVSQAEIAVESFISQDLRHHQEPAEDFAQNPLLIDWLRETFVILSRWAETGEDAADHPALDAIRSAFDNSSQAFSRIVQAEREERRLLSETVLLVKNEKSALEKTLSEHAAATIEESRKVSSLSSEAEALRQELATLRTAEEEARKATQAAKEDREANVARMGELEAEVTKKIASVKMLQRHVAEMEARLSEAEQQREALDSKTEELIALRDQLAQVQSALIQRQHESETTAAALAEARMALGQKSSELGILAVEVNNRDSQLTEARTALQRESETATQLASALEEAQRALHDRYNEIATLTQYSIRQQADIDALDDVKKNLTEELESARVVDEARQEEVSRLHHQLAEAMQQRDAAAREVQLLRQSTSWRLTSPIRRFVDLFRQ